MASWACGGMATAKCGASAPECSPGHLRWPHPDARVQPWRCRCEKPGQKPLQLGRAKAHLHDPLPPIPVNHDRLHFDRSDSACPQHSSPLLTALRCESIADSQAEHIRGGALIKGGKSSALLPQGGMKSSPARPAITTIFAPVSVTPLGLNIASATASGLLAFASIGNQSVNSNVNVLS